MTAPTDPLARRCADGRGCVEVVARLEAADVARRIGEIEAAEKLRAAAAKYAEIHNHGRPNERAG